MEIEKNFIIVVKLSQETDRNRLVQAAIAVKEVVGIVSTGSSKLFFSSEDAKSFGFFVSSKMDAGKIRATLYGETKIGGTAALLNSDSAIVVEIGRDFSAFGFSNSWHWLQNA